MFCPLALSPYHNDMNLHSLTHVAHVYKHKQEKMEFLHSGDLRLHTVHVRDAGTFARRQTVSPVSC
jgi:hypothetical protein